MILQPVAICRYQQQQRSDYRGSHPRYRESATFSAQTIISLTSKSIVQKASSLDVVLNHDNHLYTILHLVNLTSVWKVTALLYRDNEMLFNWRIIFYFFFILRITYKKITHIIYKKIINIVIIIGKVIKLANKVIFYWMQTLIEAINYILSDSFSSHFL